MKYVLFWDMHIFEMKFDFFLDEISKKIAFAKYPR